MKLRQMKQQGVFMVRPLCAGHHCRLRLGAASRKRLTNQIMTKRHQASFKKPRDGIQIAMGTDAHAI